MLLNYQKHGKVVIILKKKGAHFMQKVKCFQSSHIIGLEDKINEFIQSKNNIDILHTSIGHDGDYILALITYKERIQ